MASRWGQDENRISFVQLPRLQGECSPTSISCFTGEAHEGPRTEIMARTFSIELKGSMEVKTQSTTFQKGISISRPLQILVEAGCSEVTMETSRSNITKEAAKVSSFGVLELLLPGICCQFGSN